MKVKKTSCDMVSSKTPNSLTVFRTGIFENGKQLVITAGYHTDMTFGYFICWEQYIDGAFVYSDQVGYQQKTSEKTYQDIVQSLDAFVKKRESHSQ